MCKAIPYTCYIKLKSIWDQHLRIVIDILMLYFRFPELPPDTEDSNPVMRWKEFPDFPNITHEGVVRAGAKRSIDFEVQLDKHITQLEG